MPKRLILAILVLLAYPTANRGDTQGHSHNDYAQARPLFAALENGYLSIEADVYLVSGELLVGHNQTDLKADKSLRSMYLEPLRAWSQKVGAGKLKPGSIQLMVDIKQDAKGCYRLLLEQLSSYGDLVAVLEKGVLNGGPVRVVLSGNRPFEEVTRDHATWVGLDGKVEHISVVKPAFTALEMPMISAAWPEVCAWDGKEPVSEAEKAKLKGFIELCHKHGRTARLWGGPDRPEVWKELKNLDMDWVNTDFLAKAAETLGLKPLLKATRQP